MWTTYWWEITGNSDLCGEEFFTCLENASLSDHLGYVTELFPGTVLKCHGKVTESEAEMMGLDTY